MLIRRIQPHELNSLLELYAHLHAEDDTRPEQKVVEAVWQEALANPRCRYFAAYVGDRSKPARGETRHARPGLDATRERDPEEEDARVRVR